jgi:signal transduction histidine kinase
MKTRRAETDESLRTERSDTDRALSEIRAAEQASDNVVDLARHQADALQVEARGKADHDSEQSRAIEEAAVQGDRALADEVLQGERATEDDRLRRERDDDGHALGIHAAEQASDEVVTWARHQADALLVAARHKADRTSEQSRAIARAAVQDNRALADVVLQGERATADDRLRHERQDDGRVLSELLPLERENTDRHLQTERTRSDEALANRDDFLGIVSHDLRNLLGALLMAASALKKKPSDGDEQRRIAAEKRVELYAARMNRLIGDLVDVVSIDAGKLATTIVPSEPLALIADTLETFRSAAEKKGLVFESEITGALPRAAFDYGRMLQVFANLVGNAIKFSSRGGKICIRGECRGSDVHFSVSDTGAGIRANMFDAVFVRFWQAAQNDRRGTGLGLYISKSIVEAHGGRIWIESKVGQGSTFHFTVPVAESP